MAKAKYEMKWLDGIELADQSKAAQKLLILLTHRKYKWRTEHNLSKKSDLARGEVLKELDDLRQQKLITVSLSKSKKIIYGLRGRVRSD